MDSWGITGVFVSLSSDFEQTKDFWSLYELLEVTPPLPFLVVSPAIPTAAERRSHISQFC